jgi:putative addiction module CopG family antidote
VINAILKHGIVTAREMRMDITLHPDDEKLIQQKVRSGQYPDAAALISAALRALRHLERTRADVRRLLDDRWEEANAPGTKWLDGEQAVTDQENRVSEQRRVRARGG